MSDLSNHQDDVEAMIDHIAEFYISQGSIISIKDKLRELVNLARKTQAL